MKTVFFSSLFLVGAICFASDVANPDQPKSPAAVAAINKHDKAVAKARQDFDQAVGAADRQYVADLDDAMRLAMKAENVEEIKRIDAARKAVNSGTKAVGVSPLIGSWRTQSSAGDNAYTFSPTEVRHRGSARGVPTYRGNQVEIRWDDGWLEIWTLGTEHAQFEAWIPEAVVKAPTAPPTLYGVAERVTDQK
jgi:hypothetical protein